MAAGPSFTAWTDDAVEAFVRRPDRDRREGPAHEVPDDLRLPLVVEQAPTGAGHEVARPEDDPAVAPGSCSPPLTEHLGHHLSGDEPRALPVVGVVAPDPMQELEVMVAHVGEIPVGAAVAHDAFARRGRRRVRNICEGEALGRETNRRAAGVVERPEVGAHAEVVGDAAIGAERLLAAGRGRRKVGGVDARLRDQGRDHSLEQLASAERRIEAEHADLLFDFAVPADDGQARPARDLLERLAELGLDELAKRRHGERVVHVGEHQVLPDEEAQLVAEVVERRRLVDGRAGDADQVQPGIAQSAERLAEVLVGNRRPHGAAGEDRHAVHLEGEPVPRRGRPTTRARENRRRARTRRCPCGPARDRGEAHRGCAATIARHRVRAPPRPRGRATPCRLRS